MFNILLISTLGRWMDGSFQDLNSDDIEKGIDEFNREIFKIHKVFKLKEKKILMEKEERDRERKKRKRFEEEEADKEEVEEEAEELQLPAALSVCNVVQDELKSFKARKIFSLVLFVSLAFVLFSFTLCFSLL